MVESTVGCCGVVRFSHETSTDCLSLPLLNDSSRTDRSVHLACLRGEGDVFTAMFHIYTHTRSPSLTSSNKYTFLGFSVMHLCHLALLQSADAVFYRCSQISLKHLSPSPKKNVKSPCFLSITLLTASQTSCRHLALSYTDAAAT